MKKKSFTISKRTLEMIDKSMDNFAKGVVSEPIDMNRMKRVLKKLEDDERKEKKMKKKKVLNLYLIKSEPERCEYGVYTDAVVIAETPSKAKMIHPDGRGDEWSLDTWVTPDKLKVTYLGKAKNKSKVGVVCASFNAG